MKKIVLLLSIITLMFLSCDKDRYEIEYVVTGSCSQGFDITYENADGGTSQLSNVTSGWSYSFEGEPDMFVYISAQTNCTSSTVYVEILQSYY